MLNLPQTNLAQANVIAENLRREVDDCSFHYVQGPVAITVSCGLAEFKKGDTVESVFLRADAALYAAKQDGRHFSNRQLFEKWSKVKVTSFTLRALKSPGRTYSELP